MHLELAHSLVLYKFYYQNVVLQVNFPHVIENMFHL